MPYATYSHRGRARKMRKDPTEAERALWTHLRQRRMRGFRFRRQHSIPPFIVDFACPQLRLAIEIDGSQHDEDKARDEWRSWKLGEAGYRVIRFWNDDVLMDVDVVLDSIHMAVEACEKRWGS